MVCLIIDLSLHHLALLSGSPPASSDFHYLSCSLICLFIYSGLLRLSCSPLSHFSLARLSILTRRGGSQKQEVGGLRENLKEKAAGPGRLWADICASD